MENAVGAHFLNHGLAANTGYWSESEAEVDFVVESGRSVTAFEVKSGRRAGSAGVDAFRRRHPAVKIVAIGTGGIPLEDFFASPPQAWT